MVIRLRAYARPQASPAARDFYRECDVFQEVVEGNTKTWNMSTSVSHVNFATYMTKVSMVDLCFKIKQFQSNKIINSGSL